MCMRKITNKSIEDMSDEIIRYRSIFDPIMFMISEILYISNSKDALRKKNLQNLQNDIFCC